MLVQVPCSWKVKIIQSMPAFDTHGVGGAFEKVSLSIVFHERFSIILNGLDAVSSLFALSSPGALELGPFRRSFAWPCRQQKGRQKPPVFRCDTQRPLGHAP